MGPQQTDDSFDKAVAYYVNSLGFTLDWADDEGGIAGISISDCAGYPY